MHFLKNFLLLIIPLLSLGSCVKDGNTIVIEDEIPEDTRPVVYFFFREGAMGDLGFIDNFYEGITRATEKNNLLCTTFELPADSAELDQMMSGLFQIMSINDEKRPALYIFVNDNMEWLFHRYADVVNQINSKNVLLAETNDTTLNISTMSFCGYGVAYQAAQVVGTSMEDVSRTLVVSANPVAQSIKDMRNGFKQGINDCLAADDTRKLMVDNIYLSDTDKGFNSADSLYKLSYIVKTYDLALPLCGGSIHALFRYNRENPILSFYTIGMDVDQQQYSSWVPFSIIKNIGVAIEDWITLWANDISQPQHIRYGLDSGYMYLKAADKYKDRVQDAIDESYKIAVEKEQEYENKQH